MAEYQSHLFTKRWRKVPAPVPSEFQIQASLIAQLRVRCRPGVIYFAVPNGELRDPRSAAKLKAMGVRPGVADLQFIWSDVAELLPDPCYPRTYVLFLELKRPGGKQSPAQQQFQTECGTVCAHYEIAETIDQAIAVLEQYGILKTIPGQVPRRSKGPDCKSGG